MYRSKKYSRKHVKVAFGFVTLSLALMLMVSVSGVVLAANNASGVVFRDYNANGTQDPNEPGVGGVTINAYGAGGTIVGTTVSDTALATLGNYTITWASADAKVRLEYIGLPGVAQQGAFGATGGSGTSVQFVDAGATTVNYGINRPSDYCLATPNLKVVTTCFESGDQNTANRVVVSHNYDGTGTDNTVTVANQVGTAWGVAYKRAENTVPATPGFIYVSAFAKRQAGYGPGGSGAIYAIQQPGTTATVLATIPNAGSTLHTAPYISPTTPTDSTFYGAPGTESLGDMDISEDGTTLYVVNLNDKQLYSVNIATKAVTAHGVIGTPTCVNGEYRPFGLGVRDGLVYVGGVCDADLPAGTPTDLQAYVFSYNPATNARVQVLNFALNYPRGCADIDPTYTNGTTPIACRTTANGSQADWEPWRDTWPNPQLTPPGSGFSPNPGGDQFFTYPEPILSGIEFVGEDMVVSLRDRMGDQIGYRDNGPNGTFPTQLVEVTAGDILRASPNALGSWTIEGNAQGADFGPSAGNGNEQGPTAAGVSGEFYYTDNLTGFHDETVTGGIVQVPGAGEITAEVMDPLQIFTAGTAWFDNGTGARRTVNGSFEIIPPTGPFGKGNGLGDLAALCDSAPVEIGNYVWFDANKNGVQDPNETPLANIEVQLFDPTTAKVIATATTDANGQYIFSNNAAGTTTLPFRYGLPITENTAYQVRIDMTQPNLAGFTVTTPTVGSGANATRDSNGVLNTVTNFDITNVTIGTSGQNNHTLDFGFFVGTPPTTLTPPPSGTSTPNLVADISKTVDPPFAMPGDQVRWTITLHNPHAVAINNVSFVDNFPSQLEVLNGSVDTTGGTLVVDPSTNRVSYDIVVMSPGQTIHVTVVTRIKANTPLPFIINNTVNLQNGGGSSSSIGSATATLLSVGSLPATGFEPPWREPLLIGIGVLLALFGIGVVRIRRRRYNSS